MIRRLLAGLVEGLVQIAESDNPQTVAEPEKPTTSEYNGETLGVVA